MHAEVVSISIGRGGIPKCAVEHAVVTSDGLAGDDHDHDKHITPMQALSILDIEDLDELRAEGFEVGPGATGENVTCRGLDIDTLEVGDRLSFSGGVVVELTKQRKPCYVLDSIDPNLKLAAVGRIGFYARVITPGELCPGESITVQERCPS